MIKNLSFLIPANGLFKNATLSGNFIRCLDSGNGIVFARLMYQDQTKANSEFELEKGLGFETNRFYGIHLRNNSDNDILLKLIVSDEGAVIDTRTSGALSIGAANRLTLQNPINISDTVNGATVFAQNAFRKSGTFTIDADCYIGANNGVIVQAGSTIQWENTNALILIPVSSPVIVKSFDETN